MRIIRERQRHHEVTHRLCYSYGEGGHGFSFPCDETGKVLLAELQPAGVESYRACVKGEITVWVDVEYKSDGKGDYVAVPGTGRQVTYPVRGPGHEETERNWSEPAIGECNRCQREVELHGFTNTCECGADYNMSGQELADRSQWGEETGESLSDILSIP